MVAEFGGRVIDTAGDGILPIFPSVVNAVKCAVAIQSKMAERNSAIEAERRMQFRVGINIGDVVYDEVRIYGDGINVAARLEGIAEPGGICISSKVYEEIDGWIELAFEDIGEQQLKNIARKVRVYRVRLNSVAPTAAQLTLPDKPSIAVLPFQNMSGDPEQDYFADRHSRRDYHRAVAYTLVIRDRPQFELYLQGSRSRREAGWPRAGGALRAGGERAQCRRIECVSPGSS